MSKITRWKGGIKGGNRREVDMTRGSFNKEFNMNNQSESVGDAIWRIMIDDEKHSFETSRLEQQQYDDKLICNNDYTNSYNFVSNVLGGGFIYDNGDVRKQLIQSGVNDVGSTVISNTSSGLDLLKDGKQAMRMIEPIEGESWETIQSLNPDEFKTTSWTIDYPIPDPLVYFGVRFFIKEQDVPVRLTLSTANGHVWYTSIPEYDWLRGYTGPITSNTAPVPTEWEFLDPFFLDADTIVKVTLEAKEPITLLGLFILDKDNNPIPGPDDGKVFNGQAEVKTANVDITPIDFKTLGHGVFVINIEPLDKDTIVTEVLSQHSTDETVSAIITDSYNILVDIEWDRSRAWNELPKVNGLDVTIDSYEDGTYTGHIELPLSEDTIEIIITKGTFKRIIPITRPQVPIVLSSYLTQTYPGSQTELKEGDLFELNIETDIAFTEIYLTNGLAEEVKITVPSTTILTIEIEVTNTTKVLEALPQYFRVGNPYLSLEYSTSNTLNHNDLRPTINNISIEYPIGQEALKNTESAIVYNTVFDYDSVEYIGLLDELTITNPFVYENKNVSRLSGDYNVYLPNLRIQATRNANNSTAYKDIIVKIANIYPEISISYGGIALRSGGNDGTLPQNYPINIFSNQFLLNAPSCNASIGTFQGSGFSWMPATTIFTRDLQIHDNDNKGLGYFTGLVAVGLSGLTTTIFTGTNNYTVSGFISRDLILSGGTTDVVVGTEIVIPEKLIVYWDFTGQYLVYTTNPAVQQPGKYNVNTLTSTIKLLDKDATDASTQDTIVTVEEIV